MPTDNMIFDINDYIREGKWFVRPLNIWMFEYEDQWLYVVSSNPRSGNIDEREVMTRSELDTRFPTVRGRIQ